VHVPAPSPATPQPEDLPLSVVHEDSHLLIIDKPAGLVVHPGAGTASGTLVNALLGHVRDLSGIGGVLRPGIVHRLDRGTSGLLVVAKDDETHRALVRQFSSRRVEKEYLALVLGVPRSKTGEITGTIGRHPVHRKKMSVDAPRGREARTSWSREESFDGAGLLRVRIHTGRTHQIRVHLASIGHPVAGDSVYATGAVRRGPDRLERLFLHAWKLEFLSPGSGRLARCEAPLPGELESVLEGLRASDEGRS
jgi:23S rRNA pseudouridine1911/1915/1917 synthase